MQEPEAIQETLVEALGGELERARVKRNDDGVWVAEGWLRSPEADHAEVLAVYEELAAEAVGAPVFLAVSVMDPGIPIRDLRTLVKDAESPQDIVQVRMPEPGHLRVRARFQPLTLGRKRNRLPRVRKALPRYTIEAEPLGSCADVGGIHTLDDVREFLAPFLAASPEDLSPESVHEYRVDTRHQGLQVVVDAPGVPAIHRLQLARRIRDRTDVDVEIRHRITGWRAREIVYEALAEVPGLERWTTRWDDTRKSVDIVVDAERSRREALDAFVRRQERALGVPVAWRFDTRRSLLVDRIARSFPEEGILTAIRHLDENLYRAEALLPLKDPAELARWTDEVEATWGARVMLDEPFLRAPDIRHRDEMGADRETIARRYNRPTAFSAEALEQARIAVQEHDVDRVLREQPHRRDIRSTVVLSIDPTRTRDLDDSLSIRELETGLYEVGVHIADVSHFVPQDSPLDREALLRGYTTYLARGEIPVLPEILANQACSLHGGEDSLALSLFVRLDAEARVQDFELVHTAIHNHCRLDYGRAQRILDTPLDAPDAHPHAWRLHTFHRLARILRARRKEEGSLDLNLDPDPEGPSHQLIEEFMLLANECVARFLIREHPTGLCLYRTHPHVSDVNWGPLQQVGHFLGCDVRVEDQRTMQLALEELAGTEAMPVFRFHVGQLLEKATYHFEQLGHGALAKTHYAHFTSPIRRYPDLIVHRLVEDALFREAREDRSSYTREELIPMQDHLNAMEIRVDAASYESHKLEELRRYDRPGREMEGRVLSLVRGRVWIGFEETRLLATLPYRERHPREDLMPVRIDDVHTGLTFALGQPVTVRTRGVDPVRKNIEVQVVG